MMQFWGHRAMAATSSRSRESVERLQTVAAITARVRRFEQCTEVQQTALALLRAAKGSRQFQVERLANKAQLAFSHCSNPPPLDELVRAIPTSSLRCFLEFRPLSSGSFTRHSVRPRRSASQPEPPATLRRAPSGRFRTRSILPRAEAAVAPPSESGSSSSKESDKVRELLPQLRAAAEREMEVRKGVRARVMERGFLRAGAPSRTVWNQLIQFVERRGEYKQSVRLAQLDYLCRSLDSEHPLIPTDFVPHVTIPFFVIDREIDEVEEVLSSLNSCDRCIKKEEMRKAIYPLVDRVQEEYLCEASDFFESSEWLEATWAVQERRPDYDLVSIGAAGWTDEERGWIKEVCDALPKVRAPKSWVEEFQDFVNLSVKAFTQRHLVTSIDPQHWCSMPTRIKTALLDSILGSDPWLFQVVRNLRVAHARLAKKIAGASVVSQEICDLHFKLGDILAKQRSRTALVLELMQQREEKSGLFSAIWGGEKGYAVLAEIASSEERATEIERSMQEELLTYDKTVATLRQSGDLLSQWSMEWTPSSETPFASIDVKQVKRTFFPEGRAAWKSMTVLGTDLLAEESNPPLDRIAAVLGEPCLELLKALSISGWSKAQEKLWATQPQLFSFKGTIRAQADGRADYSIQKEGGYFLVSQTKRFEIYRFEGELTSEFVDDFSLRFDVRMKADGTVSRYRLSMPGGVAPAGGRLDAELLRVLFPLFAQI